MKHRYASLAALAALTLGVAGCGPRSGGTISVEVAATDRERQELGELTRTTYDVIAQSGPLTSGRHVLTLSRTVTVGDEVTPEMRFVLLAGGRGTFTDTHYRPIGRERPLYSEWNSDGAAPLAAVTVSPTVSK